MRGTQVIAATGGVDKCDAGSWSWDWLFVPRDERRADAPIHADRTLNEGKQFQRSAMPGGVDRNQASTGVTRVTVPRRPMG